MHQRIDVESSSELWLGQPRLTQQGCSPEIKTRRLFVVPKGLTLLFPFVVYYSFFPNNISPYCLIDTLLVSFIVVFSLITACCCYFSITPIMNFLLLLLLSYQLLLRMKFSTIVAFLATFIKNKIS